MSENSYNKTSHIMFLKEQVLRFAAAVLHTHTTNQIIDLAEKYAKKEHSSTGTEYGQGNKTKYGHVKVDDTVDENSINTIQNKTITTYINNIKTNLQDQITQLKNQLDTHTITSIINDSNKYSNAHIPTVKAVWDAISSYKDLLIGIDLARPQSINEDINQMTNPGYYKQIGLRHFSYGGETIYYTNALIKVEKQSNRIIQHVYATEKMTIDGKTTYSINGCEYTRWGMSETNWGAWHVSHKPYTKTTRVSSLGVGVDEDSIAVYENTAGFIIHWDQHEQERDKYVVSTDLYEYTDVCRFDPPLPIKGPYVFGNLIGRMDIKITSDKMQIRSNVSKGGRIIEMHETYFVPRNQ